ncbi:uncharacterized protein LOC124628821 [Ictalurus punctatus]|uniref:Uncharacterized protein LOC124628821 n=1 Tax=Ictalurus punctatus TaxID=7998 RepID=A0A979F6A4_ICTPU|nr:uncharacterized protein LOC124628821 [Ictalurus punctatus]
MIRHTHGGYVSESESEESDELRASSMNAQLRQENKALKSHVERLQILLSDVPHFEEEKRTMLEALHQSCVREPNVKERLKEEERENECIEDALADLTYILRSEKPRQIKLVTLKREVLTAKCCVEDMQISLDERDEIIRRKDAELVELFAFLKDCSVHAEGIAARIEDAEKAVRAVREREVKEPLRVRDVQACEVKWKKTPTAPVKRVQSEVRQSRVNGMLVTVCCFALTLIFMLFFTFSVLLPFSCEDSLAITCTEAILDSVEELRVPFRTADCTA